MSAQTHIDTLVDPIFTDGKIDHLQLKQFLKFISGYIPIAFETLQDIEGLEEPDEVHEPPAAEEQEAEDEEVAQVKYLSVLISNCEERLANLLKTPKTRIIIRNEGEKLQTIADNLEWLHGANCNLQNQINDLTTSHEKFKKLECERKQHFQDMIDRLYQDSMNSDLCNLRRMCYGLQNQVDELIVKSNFLESDTREIQKKIVALERIPVLEEKVCLLLDWRASLREEFNLFVERYEHVKTVKAGKCEVHDLLKEKVSYCHLSKYIQKVTFEVAKKEFISEFDQLKELFCALQLHFSAKLVALHKDVQMVLSQLASKRRLEKRDKKN